MPPAQARAFVRAIEIENAGAKDTLATKHDLVLLREELSKVEARLEGQIHASASGVARQMYMAVLG